MKDTFSTYHPLLNLLYFCGTIGVTIFVTHPVLLGISFVTGICYSILLKGLKHTVKFNLLFSLPAMVIVALINPMFNHYGVTIIGYLYNGNPFTLESCVYGVVMALMLACTLIWFSCYTEVMTSDKFIYLFGRIIPALSLVLSMCLRFVPKFTKQMGVISDSQKCVGRSVENGSLVKRVKHGITIFSILVTWSLENAIETADSMKCRGYGEKGRTAFSIYRFDKRDGLLLLFMAVSFGMVLFGAVHGYAFASYNPRISIDGLPLNLKSGMTFGAYAVFSLMPTVIELLDRQMWKVKRAGIEKETAGGYRLWEV
ncbi:MAG: energy-coupling factor transporter transmembrane component T [Lachnospiraceae bacterium]|nr:energy-coupling factor transporter transmembrane component T [Lachnospiraceae bacterium]